MALYGLARSLEKQGKADEARATFKQVVDMYPGSPVSTSAKSDLGRLGG